MSSVDPASVAGWARHVGHDIDPQQLRAQLSAGTFPQVAAASAAEHPDRLAFSVDGHALTHAELDDLAGRTATRLIDLGVAQGDRVLLCTQPSLDFVVGYLALLRARAVVVLANPAYTRTELAHQIEVAGARLALADTGTADTLAAAGTQTVQLGEVVAQAPSYEKMPVPDVPGDEVMVLAFTSGTTGRAKGVPLTHANLLSSARAIATAWRWVDDDVLVHALPLFHQHGLGALHVTLIHGTSAHIASRFEPGALIDLAERCRASVLFAVPAVHQRLVEHPRAGALGRLRVAISGSAPMSPGLFAKVAAAYGHEPVERYGLTESGLDVSNPYDGPRVPGTVGFPLPGVEVRLADPEGPTGPGGDAEPPAGRDEGEIVVRGPQVFAGYWDDPEATAAASWPGGWFRTGDLGTADAEGRITISGRLKELIISGGFNVMPAEVEHALEQHPDVAEVAVAGIPSERWGEEVTAWVVPTAGAQPDPSAMIEGLREQLAPYKVPKRIVLTESLPRNAMGKIVRTELTVEDG